MREMTVAEVAVLCGAGLVGDPSVMVGPDVVIDSRAATAGSLFVALPGERVDGHSFIDRAVAAGAVAVLCTREVSTAVPQVIVEDAQDGLSRLAAGLVAIEKARGLTCIGITGSSGKTSTKDLVAQVLIAAGPTVAPVGSFNNEIGVPLTATRVDASTIFLVSELGARGVGHIRSLCSIVPPDVGVVVNVGHAHLGEFGSVDAIAQAKGELVEALPADGWAVLNADDPLVAAMATRTPARVAAFSVRGEPATGALRVWSEAPAADDLQRYSFTLHAGGTVAGSAPVTLRVSGAHQVGNALAAAAVALTQAMPLDVVAEALSRATARSRWRMEFHERPDGVLVVNDAYNANPDSMRAALQTLASLRRPGGRLVAVLGDMLELGEDSAARHAAIGELAGEVGVDQLIAVGSYASDLVAGAAARGVAATVAADAAAAADLALAAVSPPDVVLVKASRGLALESVADRLARAGDVERGESQA